LTRSLLKPLTKPSDASQAVFMVAGLGGHVLRFRPLAKALRPRWHMTGLLYPFYVGGATSCPSIEELATRMRAPFDQIDSPIILVGYSIGGAFAYQIATDLRASGKDVAVVCIDTKLGRLLRKRGRLLRGFRYLLYRKPRMLLNMVREMKWPAPNPRPAPVWQPDDEDLQNFVQDCRRSVRRYRPPQSDVPVVLIRAQAHLQWRNWIDSPHWPLPDHGWAKVAPVAEVVPGPGDHLSIVYPEHLDDLAQSVDRALEIALRSIAQPGRRGDTANSGGSSHLRDDIASRQLGTAANFGDGTF